MSALPNSHPITVEEFERLPDHDGIQELLDGVVVEMPPPKRRDTEICRAIESVLLRHLHRSRIWAETGFLIGQHCPQPDVAVTYPDQGMAQGWFAGAPMLAVEVASRGNTPDQLEWKKDLYLANGAIEVWIVYDKTRTVVVHTAAGTARCSEEITSRTLNTTIPVAELFG